jgi:hypothetical protein
MAISLDNHEAGRGATAAAIGALPGSLKMCQNFFTDSPESKK